MAIISIIHNFITSLNTRRKKIDHLLAAIEFIQDKISGHETFIKTVTQHEIAIEVLKGKLDTIENTINTIYSIVESRIKNIPIEKERRKNENNSR